MKKTKITIDLNQTDTKSFNNKELLQRDAKKKFIKKVNFFIEDKTEDEKLSCSDKRQGYLNRVHNTILINSKRGSGKTSFILSMMSDEEFSKDIYPLRIIDPTLIESKEHIFLHIISLIKQAIDDYQDNNCQDYQEEWKKSLIDLAGGLNILDGIGSNHLHDNLWDSPELILEKGLKSSKHGLSLEENFHKFIKCSLKVLNKKAFFLILDDIDTSMDKGRDILETLRKYLTSKQLIITMLGDIDLYSTLVRQLQWEKMDPQGTLEKYEEIKDFTPQIEHLEEQYLTKVLKPENRIDLLSIYDMKDDININTKENINNENKSLVNFMEELIKEIYLDKNHYRSYFEKSILTQSTRSIFQILQQFNDIKDKETVVSQYLQQISDINHTIKNNKPLKIQLYIERYKHTFFTTLKKRLKKFNLIEIPAKEDFLPLLAEYILKSTYNKEDALKLVPIFSNEEENLVAMHLSSMSNHLLEPKAYLSYFIKVGYAYQRYHDLDLDTDIKHQKFIEHISLNHDSSSEVAKKLLTTFLIDTNTHNYSPIFLGNISISQSQLSTIKNNTNNLSLLYSRVRNPKGGTYGFISFFNLIGFLSDLSQSADTINESFWSRHNLIKDFMVYENDKQEKTDNEESSDLDFDIDSDLKNKLTAWANKSNNINLKLPPYVLAKIWLRVSYTFLNIEERSENSKKTQLEFLELYSAGFLNALFVEIELYKNKDIKDIKNPLTSSKIFYDKLKNYQKNQDSYTLFDYMCECPIFNSQEEGEEPCIGLKNLNKTLKALFPGLGNLKAKRIDFSKLSREEQKSAIESISGWNGYELITLSVKLREKGYINVSVKSIDKIVSKLKNEQ